MPLPEGPTRRLRVLSVQPFPDPVKTGILNAFIKNYYTKYLFLARGEFTRLRMTQFSNFAIRILMYTALKEPRLSTVPEMAKAYGVSYDHLKKAAAELCRLGYLETVRGRTGGYRLAKHPHAICIGTVIRQLESEMTLVECFDPATNRCPIVVPCRLRMALQEALAAFFAVLDRYTLADLIRDPQELQPLLGLDPDCPAAAKARLHL